MSENYNRFHSRFSRRVFHCGQILVARKLTFTLPLSTCDWRGHLVWTFLDETPHGISCLSVKATPGDL